MAMASENALARYRGLYALLLRLYPKPHRERFGEEMRQTFNDLLRGRGGRDGGSLGFVLWLFAETFAGILKENMTFMKRRNKNILRIAIATAVLLLVPLAAMQLTDKVDWSVTDFAAAAALLFGTGLLYELVAGRGGTLVYRAAVALALGTALLLVWSNLAVGIVGNERHPFNLAYFAVLAVGCLGALLARLRPRGMARALFATALAQAAVAAAALVAGMQGAPESSVPEILAVNAFFVVLWVGAALLFRHAARGQGERGRAEA